MSRPGDDPEFYVGYLPHAPRGVARRVRATVIVLYAAAGLVAAGLALVHGPFGDGVFEFGHDRELAGTLRTRPYPRLVVSAPHAPPGAPPSEYLLVAPGKFGAAGLVDGLDGARVRLTGRLVYRDGRTLVEIAPGSVRRDDLDPAEDRPDALAAAAAPEDLGVRTLRGEIVDSKCYLGVMNPGEFKTHKACAIRCISGGVPPVLVVRAPGAAPQHYLLVDDDGGAVNRRVLDLVAEPLEITGRVTRDGDALVLWADPDAYRRSR